MDCEICGNPDLITSDRHKDGFICDDCFALYPGALLKATHDEWPIYVGLKSGGTFTACHCVLDGSEWVRFHNENRFKPPAGYTGINDFAGGLEGRGAWIHLSNIAWVVDSDS